MYRWENGHGNMYGFESFRFGLRDEAARDEAACLWRTDPVIFTDVVQEVRIGQLSVVQEIHSFASEKKKKRFDNMR